jgi:hypothetical protein
MATKLLCKCETYTLTIIRSHFELFYSEKLTESAYRCEWIDAPKEFKQNLLVFMTRTQFPLKLYAGGYFTLSLTTYMAVCVSFMYVST